MSTASASGARDVRKVAVAVLIGTSIEWYDLFIYGLAAALSPAGSTAVTGYLVAIIALSMLGAAGIGRLTRAGHPPAHAPESDAPGLQALNQ